MIPRPHTGVMRRRATFHPPSATWAATTKSLNWAATAKSLNCYRQCGTLGLSEAAASRQTGQSEGWGVSSLARSQPSTLQSVACLWLGQQALMAMTMRLVCSRLAFWHTHTGVMPPLPRLGHPGRDHHIAKLNGDRHAAKLASSTWHSGLERSGCLTTDWPV